MFDLRSTLHYKFPTPMNSITSHRALGVIASTCLALHCSLGGEPAGNSKTDNELAQALAIANAPSPNNSAKPSTASTSSTSSNAGSARTDKNGNKIYWLAVRLDAMTDSGVLGLKIGTKVTLVAPEKDGKLKVKTDDDVKLDVTKDQITDDESQAQLLAQQEADKEAAQAAAQAQQQQAAALAAAMQPPPVFVPPAPVAQGPSNTNSEPLTGSSLDKGAYNVVTSPKPKPTPKPTPVQIRR